MLSPSYGEWGLLSSCGARTSHRRGFSRCEAQALGARASVVAAWGLSSCGALAQLLRSMWELPGPGIEPVSPVLAGGFFITEPPGKPITSVLIKGGRRIRDKGNVTTEAEGQNQRLEDAILLAFFLSDFKQ